MTLRIHDQGGLTEAEIELRIEESAERREAILDTKLASHRSEIREELNATKALVNENNARQIGMQGQISVLAVETKTQTEKLDALIANGEQWHEADLTFRKEVLDRVGKIEIDHAELTITVARVKWIGVASFHLGRACRFALSKCAEAGFWKAVASVLLLWLLHLASPALAHLLSGLLK